MVDEKNFRSDDIEHSAELQGMKPDETKPGWPKPKRPKPRRPEEGRRMMSETESARASTRTREVKENAPYATSDCIGRVSNTQMRRSRHIDDYSS
jgi:hypothetical protein